MLLNTFVVVCVQSVTVYRDRVREREREREREKEVVASIVTAVWRRRGARGHRICSFPIVFSSHSDFLESVGCRGFSHIWVSMLTSCVSSLPFFLCA